MGFRSWFRSSLHRVRYGKRAFEGAKLNRLTYDFRGGQTSADAEIKGSLRQLWDRSRQVCRDNPYAAQIKRTTMVNVVGASGIRLRPRVYRLGSDRTLDERRNRVISAEWKRWCRPSSCDIAGRLSFHDFELQGAGALVESGEAIWRIYRQPFGNSRVPIGIQMIESDMLDVEKTGTSEVSGRYWRMGIEVDEYGRPMRYAILTKHPGDYDLGQFPSDSRKHVYVPASDIIHWFIPNRVSQTRGYPGLAPVLLTLHSLGEYEKAHWTRKRVQASQLGWIIPGEGDVDVDATENNQRLWDTEPGAYNVLSPGDQVLPPNFGPDDKEYDNVVRNMLRRAAAGEGVSYETVSRDFSQTNYSSSRLSILEDREWWKVIQSSFVQCFHQAVYEAWIEAAVLSQALPVGLFSDYWSNPDRYTAPRWQARSWAWVDPTKELEAIKTARELKLDTYSNQTHQHSGEEFEDVITQIATEEEFMTATLPAANSLPPDGSAAGDGIDSSGVRPAP